MRRATSQEQDAACSTVICSILGGNRVRPDSAWENSGIAVIGEITELLRRWDVWKRVEAAPNRIDALERRVAELEAKIASRPAGAVCPKCHGGEFRVTKVVPDPAFGVFGMQRRTMTCASCGHTEERQYDPNRPDA